MIDLSGSFLFGLYLHKLQGFVCHDFHRVKVEIRQIVVGLYN